MAAIFDTPLLTGDQSVDRVLNAGLPVELIFLNGAAPYSLDQTMKELAKKYAGQLLVVQIQMQDNPQTVRRFGIQRAPAVVTFKNGQVQSRADNINDHALEQHADFLLGKGPKPEPQASPDRTPAAGADKAGYQPGNAPSDGRVSGGQPVTVTDATFDQEVMRSPLPVVVDFWAPWCGPCRMVAPALERLAREWNGRVKIAKVNVDENPLLSGRYGISSIPTMMVVVNGKIIDRWAGALPEPALRSRLSALVQA